jgi:hypothetical protein
MEHVFDKQQVIMNITDKAQNLQGTLVHCTRFEV